MRPVPSSIATRLKAAAVPIAERGLDQTKIEDIAAAAAIPKATLYYYFAGKEEILSFLLTDLLTEVAGAVAVACEAPATAQDRLVGVMTAQLQIMATQPAVCQALLADLGRAGRVPEIAEALAGAFSTPLESLLAEGAADGSLRPVEDAVVVAGVIFGAVTITGLHHLVSGTPIDADRLARQLADVLLQGLGC